MAFMMIGVWMFRRRMSLLLFCLFCLWNFPALGISPREASAQAKKPEKAQASTKNEGSLISLRFPDRLELRVLVDFVSKRTGMNIIYDKGMASRQISIKAPTKIPLSSLPELLDSVLKINSLALVDTEPKGWKKIVSTNQLTKLAPPLSKQDPKKLITTQVFKIKHAELPEVNKVIKPFITQPGGSSFDIAANNLIIVTDYASNILRIRDLINLIDTPQKEVAIKFHKVLHVEAAKLAKQAKQLLTLKQTAAGKKSLLSPISLLEDNRTNSIVVVGPKPQVEEVLKYFKSFDVPLGVETKVYQFKIASPKRVDMIVKELIGDLKEKLLYNSAIDADAGMLIVTTTPAIHRRIHELQLQLDKPLKENQSPVRFYKLANATAADVLATIRQLEGGEELTNISMGSLNKSRKRKSGKTIGSGFNKPASKIGEAKLPKPPYYTATKAENKSKGNTPALHPFRKGIKTQRARVVADVNTNTIIVVGPPPAQQFYEAMIKKLDRRRPQVLIECQIVTLDTTDNFSLGVDIAGQGTPAGGKVEQWISIGQFGLNTVDASTGRMSLKATPGFNGALFSAQIADVIVHALETSGRSKILSAPRILVNDNATGTLSSTNEQPVTSVNASETVATTSFAGYASAGTVIDITPHIAEGDHLQVEYSITLNSFDGKGSGGIPAPRQTVETSSKVTIPDGHTIVVGGLNRLDKSDTNNSLPGLSKVPVLQWFPGLKDKKNQTSTLFVFIKATILRDDLFRDLKHLSAVDMVEAGLPSDMPSSEPVVME